MSPLVLHVFKDYFPPTHGGIEHHIHDVVHGLGDGFDFAVLTSSGRRRGVRERDEGAEVIRSAEWWRVGSDPFAPSWPRVMRGIGADLIHLHLPDPWAEVSFMLAGARVPAIATYHAEITRAPVLVRAFSPVHRLFLSRMRKVIVGSWPMGATAPGLGPDRDRVVAIPFGIDATAWSERPVEADALRKGIDAPVVAFVGRLVHYKGLRVLLEAMRHLEATLLVVGEGPLGDRLEEAAADLGPRVRFCGAVANEERAAYYHAADVVVLPSTSRGEGYGLTLLEAMACGVPVVSTELGTGTSWVNVNGQTGLVVPPGDTVALAGALRDLLSDPARRYGMGVAAQRRVAERFGKRGMLDALGALYRTVLGD